MQYLIENKLRIAPNVKISQPSRRFDWLTAVKTLLKIDFRWQHVSIKQEETRKEGCARES